MREYTTHCDTVKSPEFNAADILKYGNPTGKRYVIGFTNVYYTLWIVSTFATVENVFYLQNLSIDFGKAQSRLVELTGATDFEVDLDLRGTDGWNFFRPLAVKRYAPNLLSFSRFAGTDMYTINPDETYMSSMGAYNREPEYKKMSGLLWATYLNTDEKTVRGLRRRVIARSCLVAHGLLIKVGKKYLTPDQIKRDTDKELMNNATSGNHFNDGERVTITIKKIGKTFSFDTQYGTTYVMTFIDENNRLFKYMGSTQPEISTDAFTPIKATVKHSIYKEQPETKLQRIKTL